MRFERPSKSPRAFACTKSRPERLSGCFKSEAPRFWRLVKFGFVLIGLALQLALWLAAPVGAQLVRPRDHARTIAGAYAPSAPIADLSTGSIATTLSFARVLTTLHIGRESGEVRNTTVLIDPDADATRIVVAEAFARLLSFPLLARRDAVTTFATWLPPPVLQFRSS